MWTRFSRHGVGYGRVIFENMVQGFIEQHEVRTIAMVWITSTPQ
jgi:hypothetical protein